MHIFKSTTLLITGFLCLFVLVELSFAQHAQKMPLNMVQYEPENQVVVHGGLQVIDTYPFTENFDDFEEVLESGWITFNQSEPIGWETAWTQGRPDLFFGSHQGAATAYALSSYLSVDNEEDATLSTWLLTPELELQNGAELRFWTRTVDTVDFPDRMEVRLSTSGSASDVGESATDTGVFDTVLLVINPDLTFTGYPNEWTEYVLHLEDLDEPVTGRIAFRHFVTDAGAFGDNSEAIGIDTFSYSLPGDGSESFSLLSPDDGSEIEVTSGSDNPLIASWEELPGASSYTWMADFPDNDFSDPLVELEADEDGTATTLSFTENQIFELVTGLGAPVGTPVTLIWSVRAELGDQSIEADEPFTLVVTPVGGDEIGPFAPQSPESGATFVIHEGSDETIVFDWEDAENADTYFWIIDESGGDFSPPAFFTSSDEDGTASRITLTHDMIYQEMTGLGISPGINEPLIWTAVAFNDSEFLQSDVVFDVTFQLEQATSGGREHELPATFSLGPNYPNPFNPATRITFELPETSVVQLEVYTMQGRRVAVPVQQQTMQAGTHTITFNARHLASGMYLYRMKAGSFTQTRKMMLVK